MHSPTTAAGAQNGGQLSKIVQCWSNAGQNAVVPKCLCVLCFPTLPPLPGFDADVPVLFQFVIKKLGFLCFLWFLGSYAFEVSRPVPLLGRCSRRYGLTW